MSDREKLIELINDHTCLEEKDNCAEECVACLADHLIANGVTVQKCEREYWDVCNNNGNNQYRCPHCEAVHVYTYKNHIAPDVCKNCGTRLYLPEPPKGE